MLYGVIVVFYEKYEKKSISEFKKILNKINKKNKLIVVCNNKKIYEKKSDAGVVYLMGNNENWEFTGWDVGLNYINNFNNDDYIIFANDTFCHHRVWTFLERNYFISAFLKHIKNKNNAICGDKNTFNEVFSINGDKSDAWISTYLYGMYARDLKKIGGKITTEESVLSEMIEERGEVRSWGGGVSENLVNHIERWMYPVEGVGWYKNSSDDKIKIRKIKTILSEKYLSVRAAKKGISFINYSDGYKNYIIRLNRKYNSF